MDSCIEELALLIDERARRGAKNQDEELSRGFSLISSSANQIIQAIREYRAKHPELYLDTYPQDLAKLRGEADTYKDQLIIARQALAQYRAREKVFGWGD